MGTDAEARLRALEDRAAIERLLLDYGRTLDGRDSAGYAALFARDGVWIAPGFETRGPAAIKAMIDRMFANVPASATSHLMSNFWIEVDGDRATASSRFSLFAPNETGGPRIRLSGHYDDELVREDGRWRFLRRVLTHDLKAG